MAGVGLGISIYGEGGWDSLVSIVGGLRGPALLLLLFYVNVSGMCLWSRLLSQPLTIPASCVILRIGWSIPLVPPWVTLPFPCRE